MGVEKILVTNANKLTAKHQTVHDGFEYYKKVVKSGVTAVNAMFPFMRFRPAKRHTRITIISKVKKYFIL